MQVDFPSEINEINDTDFDVLWCLHNEALWKMEVTRKINSRRKKDTLIDLKDSISKQAVAKRIERLHELDYLESSIISVNRNGNKQFILGYTTTQKGDEIFQRALRLVLRNALSKMITESLNPEEVQALDDHISIYSGISDKKQIKDIHDFVEAELK